MALIWLYTTLPLEPHLALFIAILGLLALTSSPRSEKLRAWKNYSEYVSICRYRCRTICVATLLPSVESLERRVFSTLLCGVPTCARRVQQDLTHRPSFAGRGPRHQRNRRLQPHPSFATPRFQSRCAAHPGQSLFQLPRPRSRNAQGRVAARPC